ncbi:MAG TPA: glycosyltransferase, partial [Symbiobacteriaceae bacterium]|nr:glycosyltransferase [Symbiobacteriaceae bacterium]
TRGHRHLLITMLATGTRGDIQPFIALGVAVQRKGIRVRLAASEAFREFIEGYGLEFAPVRGDITKVMESDLAKDARTADNPLKFFTSMRNPQLIALLEDVTQDLHEACTGADAVVYHPGAGVGYFAAQAMHVPSILATPFPMTPTRDYPALLFYNGPRLGRVYNLLTHKLFEQGFWGMASGPLKRYWGKRFGTPPQGFACPFGKQRTATHPTIVSCSPQVFARPADWPEHVHCSGYWFLESDPGYQPPADLKAFIEAGEAPVYVGFGSVSDKERAAETTHIVTEALRRAGKRGIVATGWRGMERPEDHSEDVLFIEGAPHDWLFPQMAAVVHHGGAGTTAAALRAGVPSLIVPYGNDQFAWGRRIHELGVGAQAIPRKQLTIDSLAAAIQETQAPAVKERARAIGERVRQENGAEGAANVIVACLAHYQK